MEKENLDAIIEKLDSIEKSIAASAVLTALSIKQANDPNIRGEIPLPNTESVMKQFRKIRHDIT